MRPSFPDRDPAPASRVVDIGEGPVRNDPGVLLSFFFQAEDGIRDLTVTGVQTCALPISRGHGSHGGRVPGAGAAGGDHGAARRVPRVVPRAAARPPQRASLRRRKVGAAVGRDPARTAGPGAGPAERAVRLMTAPRAAPPTVASDAGWFGHPRGLSTLFFTEMWERFSYYGMKAFLIFYMTAPVAAGGLAFDVERAGHLFGFYTGSVWAASIGGGLVADWLLGQYKSVLVGGVLIALGHFTPDFPPLPFFYAGLALIVAGTGLLKPNVSTIVGSLYDTEIGRAHV